MHGNVVDDNGGKECQQGVADATTNDTPQSGTPVSSNTGVLLGYMSRNLP